MNFNSISAFVAHMQRQLATLPQAERRALTMASDVVLKDARSIPGTYQKGWEELTQATLYGGVTPEGHYFPGKIPLGYATPSDHRPLLREGGLRDSYDSRVVGATMAEVGSNDKKAIWHELGTMRAPPRPVLLTAAVRQEKAVHAIIGRGVHAHLSGRRP